MLRAGEEGQGWRFLAPQAALSSLHPQHGPFQLPQDTVGSQLCLLHRPVSPGRGMSHWGLQHSQAMLPLHFVPPCCLRRAVPLNRPLWNKLLWNYVAPVPNDS